MGPAEVFYTVLSTGAHPYKKAVKILKLESKPCEDRKMAKKNISELRAAYRAVLTEGGYDAKVFKSRCESWLLTNGLEETPENWVRAAETLAMYDEIEDNCDTEGFMGTGMSESAYFRALGSAE